MSGSFELSRREFLAAVGSVALLPSCALPQNSQVLTETPICGGGPEDFMTVRHLKLKGTNKEIGKAIASLAKTRHQSKLDKPGKEIVQTRKKWYETHYPAMAERASGVAEEYAVDWGSDDQDPAGLLYNGIQSPGCSVVFYPASRTLTGHPTLCRNYDFTTQTLAEMMGRKSSPTDRAFTADPYVIEMHPDKGIPSLYMCSYDLVAGCIDGINAKGLAVALLADDMSPNKKPSPTSQPGVGEIEITRLLLDNCSNVSEAIEAAKKASYYYTFIPCHYLVADATGRSVVLEWSLTDGQLKVVEEQNKCQVVTNHLLSEHPDPAKFPVETHPSGSFNRYHRLSRAVTNERKLSPEEIRAINGLVMPRRQPGEPKIEKPGRTLWNSYYDLQARTMEVSFYLGEDEKAPIGQRRTRYYKFWLR